MRPLPSSAGPGGRWRRAACLAPAAACHLDRERPDAHGLSIEAMAAAGLINGYDDGTYRPYEDVPRSQAASLVVRTVEPPIGGPLDDDHPGFDDVDPDGEHAEAIRRAAAAGFIIGGQSGDFDGERDIRRDEAATVLTRVLDLLVAEHGVVLPN